MLKRSRRPLLATLWARPVARGEPQASLSVVALAGTPGAPAKAAYVPRLDVATEQRQRTWSPALGFPQCGCSKLVSSDPDSRKPIRARLAANRQRIANRFPPTHRSALGTLSCQRVASIGGGGGSCLRRCDGRRPPVLRRLHPRIRAGGFASNITNCRRNMRRAHRLPASVVTRQRCSRRAIKPGAAIDRRRKWRFRRTFMGVMRWRRTTLRN